MDKAKELGLTPEAVTKCIQQTPSGRFTLYVKGKFVKPPELQFPDVLSLVKMAQTEGGESEVSCALDDENPAFVKAVPMKHADESRPSDFTFANNVGIQTDDSEDEGLHDVPAENHHQSLVVDQSGSLRSHHTYNAIATVSSKTSTSRWAHPNDY